MVSKAPLWVIITLAFVLVINYVIVGLLFFRGWHFYLLQRIPFFEKRRFTLLVGLGIPILLNSVILSPIYLFYSIGVVSGDYGDSIPMYLLLGFIPIMVCQVFPMLGRYWIVLFDFQFNRQVFMGYTKRHLSYRHGNSTANDASSVMDDDYYPPHLTSAASGVQSKNISRRASSRFALSHLFHSNDDDHPRFDNNALVHHSNTHGNNNQNNNNNNIGGGMNKNTLQALGGNFWIRNRHSIGDVRGTAKLLIGLTFVYLCMIIPARILSEGAALLCQFIWFLMAIILGIVLMKKITSFRDTIYLKEEIILLTKGGVVCVLLFFGGALFANAFPPTSSYLTVFLRFMVTAYGASFILYCAFVWPIEKYRAKYLKQGRRRTSSASGDEASVLSHVRVRFGSRADNDGHHAAIDYSRQISKSSANSGPIGVDDGYSSTNDSSSQATATASLKTQKSIKKVRDLMKEFCVENLLFITEMIHFHQRFPTVIDQMSKRQSKSVKQNKLVPILGSPVNTTSPSKLNVNISHHNHNHKKNNSGTYDMINSTTSSPKTHNGRRNTDDSKDRLNTESPRENQNEISDIKIHVVTYENEDKIHNLHNYKSNTATIERQNLPKMEVGDSSSFQDPEDTKSHMTSQNHLLGNQTYAIDHIDPYASDSEMPDRMKHTVGAGTNISTITTTTTTPATTTPPGTQHNDSENNNSDDGPASPIGNETHRGIVTPIGGADEHNIDFKDNEIEINDGDSTPHDNENENDDGKTPMATLSLTKTDSNQKKASVLSFSQLFGKKNSTRNANMDEHKPLILPKLPDNIGDLSPVLEAKTMNHCVFVIYETFISQYGTYEINISSLVRNKLHTLIRQWHIDHDNLSDDGSVSADNNKKNKENSDSKEMKEHKENEDFDREIYDDAAKQILKLLKQSFNRFAMTEEFLIFADSLEKKQKKRKTTLKEKMNKLKQNASSKQIAEKQTASN